jgi:starch phosphorylase
VTEHSFFVEIQPRIPPALERLTELAQDLYFSWDRQSRDLFYYLDGELWEECRHNPKVFLRRISQRRLEEAASDRTFMEEYHRALANYDTYLTEITALKKSHAPIPDTELVAYFCAEFGLHESLPLYSGGLGILAGDFCKAASDLVLPFVGVGLLYRQGNVTQTLDENGNQNISFTPVDIDDLPVRPALCPDGTEAMVTVKLKNRPVQVRVWQVKAGHARLFLLDTDTDGNSEADRAISRELYPADRELRLQQEIIMGIGGVRALQKIGLEPTIWHINEGHPCLLLLERCRLLVEAGMDFGAALELVASSTVFTTHTPVTAGHEVYDKDLVKRYFSDYVKELKISESEFLALGCNDDRDGFNLTTLALRGSRFHNGVSRIHRGVAAHMERSIWSEVPVRENPVDYVTNGVHTPTFLSRNWKHILEDPGWHNELLNPDYWQRIDRIPDVTFWGVRLALKELLLEECRRLIKIRGRRNGFSEAQIQNEMEMLQPGHDVLILGFARRFATYKRADILFEDPDRLRRILNEPEKPVILIYAGKAHPHDEPGKNLIRRIHALTRQPGFCGRLLLLEGYDLSLARQMVAGADVWLNMPEYPLEASGTSGMKAAINGALNLSILDGWWAEGYNGRNGWGLQPHVSEGSPEERRRLESAELLDTLEQEVIPLYFNRAQEGYSEGWVKMAKEAMKSVIPHFCAQRMVMDYVNRFYLPSIATAGELKAEGGAQARGLAAWKASIRHSWHGIGIRRLDAPPAAIRQGESFTVSVGVKLNGLNSKDVVVECLLGKARTDGGFQAHETFILKAGEEQDGEVVYRGEFARDLAGLIEYKLRVYPFHPLLCHRFEMGFMKWI